MGFISLSNTEHKLSIKERIAREKYPSHVLNRGRWVQRANATSVLCTPPLFNGTGGRYLVEFHFQWLRKESYFEKTFVIV